MPEIWLPYGQVEVAVDIKAENLAEVLKPDIQRLDDGVLYEVLDSVEIEGGSMILLSDITNATLKVLTSLIELQIEKGRSQKDFMITAPKDRLNMVKRALEAKLIDVTSMGEPVEDAGIVDGFRVKVPRAFFEHRRIIISEVSFDPLFGFGGGPTSLIKAIDFRLIAEAFKRRLDDNPKPGLDTNAAWFASRVAEEVGEFLSIEVLNRSGEVSELFLGNMVDVHSKASKKLYESSKRVLHKPARAMLVGLGDPLRSLTLSSSIRSLWNVLGGLDKDGIVALLAECSEGLGSEAFKLYTTDRLKLDEFIKRGGYAEGLEDLIYLKTALQTYTVILTSTLPNYYSEIKLGLRTAKKASDALNYILHDLGTRTKLYVIPDASNILPTFQSQNRS
ncbi:MAG: hypothetical protein H3Z50_04885 [archaeon]|nr:hypothetical protein [archaeon]MCP8306651.1 hypothetical protein [archaeon]